MGNCLHVVKRGKGYAYVCRVPRDLHHLFPKKTIWKSLKAESAKDARLLAGAEEYRTQQLFMQLRTGMLDKELEKRLIALYLKRGVESLEALATGQATGKDKVVEQAFEALGAKAGFTPKQTREARAAFNSSMAEGIKEFIADKDTFLVANGVNALTGRLKDKHNIKLKASDKKALSLKFLDADKQLHEAESAVLRGEWSLLEALREKVNKELAAPYFDLKTVLEK